MRMLPRKKGQSLNDYADIASSELLRRTKKAFQTRGHAAVWEVLFKAVCDEGQYVREVSPAAVVIYQRYFSAAVHYLKENPDREKRDDLIRRVMEDLGHNMSWFSQMQSEVHFTHEERRDGSSAFRIIKMMLKSFA